MIPVILSGGMGSRLWPLSRRLSPKQFLPLTGETSLLAMTVQHASQLPGASAPLLVCNADHRFLVSEQMAGLGIAPDSLILEPVGRNTAPAVAAAALYAVKTDPEALLLVLPADHLVPDTTAFAQAVAAGTPSAMAGKLVTFGIVPAYASTGFGYIRIHRSGDGGGSPISAFIEKPDQAKAEKLIADGDCYWNSGMFLLRAATYLQELERFAPKMPPMVARALAASQRDGDYIFLDHDAFSACPSDSIDYAVMEHTDKGLVVPLECGWSDVGAWPALWDIFPKDDQGNSTRGDVMAVKTSDSLVISNSRLVATLGVDNLVVVETPDAILVAGKDHAQGVKGIVEALQAAGREESDHHTKVDRPWGSYESLLAVDGFQVKRIIVHPGQRLSLQLHHRRQEHWVVVRGTAKVTCGEEVSTLRPNQSIYIPIETKHRLDNPGTTNLELIEVQIGDYLGEDDIERFEDEYGRV
ncbi:mannose-1-phosphate guanylyltransferase/mannose-6-phosphate isomerase [bacterium]|nr:mannose-1-phosphate guanylyltransferase/mannose-6-phosphate isomerase [bacterium]PIV81141.1 MAG: mannose-1-phosphate guanylyltransferase/mannose-6-phosphate isomerase [bacterium CG17_big_fil_post_rev_8_21_14_2_50_64_8]PJA76852.1 MAG: mannose-1-phosphate guanylyltransferase/mannose-6-phosphate isomerase [bacterium CG_4_9_14_3_um_filter_65_15]